MGASQIDPDIQAAFSGAPPTASSNANIDPDIQAAFAGDKSSSNTSISSNKASGVGTQLLHAGEDILGGIAHQAGNLVDVATMTSPGAGSYAEKFSKPFQHDPDYEAPDVKEQVRLAASKLTDQPFMQGPLGETLAERVPQALEAAGTVASAGSLVKGGGVSTEAEEAAPHPLQGVADAESARISQAVQRGRAAGMDLPDRQISPTQGAANQIVRQEFDMPDGAPITPKMLDAVRQENYAPGYQAVERIPKVQLGSAYEDDIGNVDLSAIKDKYQPPPGGSITGARAVELSKYLREKASAYFQEGTVDGTEKGQAHWDAAQAVEDAVERRLKATGQAQTATDWDNARVGYAKTYSVQSALDGAGNVVVPKLKSQLIRGKPLSGGLEDLATMGAVNPEAFRAAPQRPTPSLFRRAAAQAAPVAGAAAGGWLGGQLGVPGLGATGGAALGQNVGEQLLGR
jgi:hypothetical protein